MFAGAAREAVFSKREVVRRIKADFIPVALKAGLVNNPPPGIEGKLYSEIGRSKPAPQGICVANSDGKVLAWSLMFEDDDSIVGFLDHCLARYKEFLDAARPLPAERFMRFPSQKLPDVADTGTKPKIPDQHANGQRCPAKPALEAGTLVGRIIGRALDKAGKPVADTLSQEHYMESRVEVPVAVQSKLARNLAAASNQRFRLDDDLVRLLVSSAYLGQLDVNPLGGQRTGGQTDRREWRFSVTQVDRVDGVIRLRFEGTSDVAGRQSTLGRKTDGRQWDHEVKLDCEGYIDVKNDRIVRLIATAVGSEKLRWGNKFWKLKSEDAVKHLPAGHPIDLKCKVRYGLIAEPCAADEVVAKATKLRLPTSDQRVQMLIGMLGSRFVVFQNAVMDDLRVSSKQRAELMRLKNLEFEKSSRLMQQIQQQPPPARHRQLQKHRTEADSRLRKQLSLVLTETQQVRLRQIQRQHQGLFALSEPTVATRLGLTNEQRRKFMGIVQEMQRQIQSLQRESRSSRNQQSIQKKAATIRKEHEAKITAILTSEQKARWKEMTGDPRSRSNSP